MAPPKRLLSGTSFCPSRVIVFLALVPFIFVPILARRKKKEEEKEVRVLMLLTSSGYIRFYYCTLVLQDENSRARGLLKSSLVQFRLPSLLLFFNTQGPGRARSTKSRRILSFLPFCSNIQAFLFVLSGLFVSIRSASGQTLTLSPLLPPSCQCRRL